ncbi:MAG: hypothetical protein AAFU79_10030, partial [Myxococcota bacterium]
MAWFCWGALLLSGAARAEPPPRWVRDAVDIARSVEDRQMILTPERSERFMLEALAASGSEKLWRLEVLGWALADVGDEERLRRLLPRLRAEAKDLGLTGAAATADAIEALIGSWKSASPDDTETLNALEALLARGIADPQAAAIHEARAALLIFGDQLPAGVEALRAGYVAARRSADKPILEARLLWLHAVVYDLLKDFEGMTRSMREALDVLDDPHLPFAGQSTVYNLAF